MTDSLFEVRFPTPISMHLIGGPMFSTDVGIGAANGHPERNVNWEDDVCQWELPLQTLSLDEFHELYAFFLKMRGRGYSFFLLDWFDYEAADSFIGIGNDPADGGPWQLVKNYTDFQVPYTMVAVSAGEGGTFSISGDHRWAISAGDFFETSGYNGDDLWYVIASLTYSGGNTVITVTGTIPAGTVSGTLIFCSQRTITRPASTDEYGTACGVDVSVGGVAQTEDTDYEIDYSTGDVTFLAGHYPAAGAQILATSFKFVKIVYFGVDKLDGDYANHQRLDTHLPISEDRSL